jgi:ABC-type lipoprotein release transport system permease subunit
MGRIAMVWRLAARDMRRRTAQVTLLLLAITAAAATLTLAIALRDASSQPFQRTRAATSGPDVVAAAFPVGARPARLGALTALASAPGVAGHSGPYPVTWVALRANGRLTSAMIEGRDLARGSIDRPKLTSGGWIRARGVVVERSFAIALGVRTGDRVVLNGKPFLVTGVAVSAALPAYPEACSIGCVVDQRLSAFDPGLIWTTRAAARSLASAAEPLTYFMNVRLAPHTDAAAFASTHNSASLAAPYLVSWQYIARQDATMARDDQRVLLTGSGLLGVLAVASVAVLVGGRMAEQTRRVGLLKAVGATPGLVAAVLLTEHVALALAAAAAGIGIGLLTAPLLASAGAGLVGAPGAPPVTVSAVGLVVAFSLAVAVAATLVPAIRAARTSTVRALADAARPPRRVGWLVAVSSRLPVPVLLALRLAARRPRRIVLNVVSVAVTVSGIVAVLVVHAVYNSQAGGSSSVPNPEVVSLSTVTLVLTVMLGLLAAVNAILIAWATVVDARRSSALERALGATPIQVSVGLSMAQLLPALVGALIGIPGGIELFTAANSGGSTVIPPAWWLVVTVFGTMLALAGLTAIPVRIGTRRPPARALQAEGA